MKNMLSLLLLCLMLASCKMEVQESSVDLGAIQLNDNQIAISTATPTSTEIERFKEELTERQERDPEQIFEVVPVAEQETSTGIIRSAMKDDHLYKNKNFYIFLALGKTPTDTNIQKLDWEAIYYIMNYLSSSQFRVLINAQATAEHLKLAAEDDQTAVILWSSHGNTNGFYDYNGNKVPYDVFAKKSKNFYQFILSACEGRIALNNHYQYTALQTWSWSGLTNPSELKSFILSDKWSALEGKELTAVKENITCTASGTKNYKLIFANTKNEVYGYTFDTLENCQSRVLQIKNQTVCSRGDRGIKRINTINGQISNETFETFQECFQ